jgi:saccharopine dehydrogenase-like NADP-dependent oxidoreductase
MDVNNEKILIVGGYGEVGRRLAERLERTEPNRVIVAGRHPEEASGFPARAIDVDDAESIERALDGIGVVVACIRQREPHLLRAAVRRGLAYTSIAPPRLPWPATELLRADAQRTGARVILGAGLEPGITSVLVRAARGRLGEVDTVETALMLSLGDAFGADSMAFILEEVSHTYSVVVDGAEQSCNAFERPKLVTFPPPVGQRRAYTMPFTDQLYYPKTVGAKTAVARIALDPPWLAGVLSAVLRAGARRALTRNRGASAVHGLIEKLRRRYVGRDQYALVVEVRGGGRTIRSTLVGRQQATATAAGAAAITEALWSREVDEPGVWLAEQVIDPKPFFARLAEQGLVPAIAEVPISSSPRQRVTEHLAPA